MPARLNESLIDVLGQLENIYRNKNAFKSRAYKKAQETIMLIMDDIVDVEVLQGKPNIGPSTLEKLREYVKTGNIKLTDLHIDLQTNLSSGDPEEILAEVYGIGPKKAHELVTVHGITTIAQLRAKQYDVLNAIQRTGLKYYEDVLKRIPRNEIVLYDREFTKLIHSINRQHPSNKIVGEIVGSYRRGAETSGDIDMILTCSNSSLFQLFIDLLIKKGIILEVLSRGQSKCLVIARLSEECPARRVDFLFTGTQEYPFSVLYFTGSKAFNTSMRAHALKQGWTMNEHGIRNKTTGAEPKYHFANEQSIFDFLGLAYQIPTKRIDGRAIRNQSSS